MGFTKTPSEIAPYCRELKKELGRRELFRAGPIPQVEQPEAHTLSFPKQVLTPCLSTPSVELRMCENPRLGYFEHAMR
jgi:hypothetical protein